MAVFLDEFKRRSNNLECRTQSRQFNLPSFIEGSEGRRPSEQGNTTVRDGDVIVIGVIPGGSVVTKATILVNEAFDSAVTATISVSADFPTLSLIPLFQNDIAIGAIGAVGSVQPYLSHVGNKNSDGTALPSADSRAAVWLGDNDKTHYYYVVLEYSGAPTGLTKGQAKLVLEYNNFSTNEGAY
jgi:hypothetical protein